MDRVRGEMFRNQALAEGEVLAVDVREFERPEGGTGRLMNLRLSVGEGQMANVTVRDAHVDLVQEAIKAGDQVRIRGVLKQSFREGRSYAGIGMLAPHSFDAFRRVEGAIEPKAVATLRGPVREIAAGDSEAELVLAVQTLNPRTGELFDDMFRLKLADAVKDEAEALQVGDVIIAKCRVATEVVTDDYGEATLNQKILLERFQRQEEAADESGEGDVPF